MNTKILYETVINRYSRGLIILFILILASTPNGWYRTYAFSNCLFEEFTVDYRITVIPVGLESNATAALASKLNRDLYPLRIYDCIAYLNTTYIIVEPGRWFEDALIHVLSTSYEEIMKPSWVLEYENSTGITLNVKGVRLTGFYQRLSALVNATLDIMGIESDETVVIIGDLDGVSRQYYEYVTYNYVANGSLRLEGVRGWAGPYPIAFYDLSVVAKPRPERHMPYYGIGRSTSYTDEPPIWSFNSSNAIGDYLVGLVRDHVRFHVSNFPEQYFSPLNVLINVTILDFGDRNVIAEIEDSLSEAEIERLTKTMVPWVNVDVAYSVVEASRYPILYSYIVDLPVNEDGFIEIDFTAVAGMLEEIAGKSVNPPVYPVYNENATYNFIILATHKPSLFKVGDRFRFTAFSAGPWGASSYPGFGYRIYNGGLPRTIAHELGHSLGEPHPFQYMTGRGFKLRWLMDWSSTIMAYDDNIIAGFIKTSNDSYVPDYYSRFRQSLIYGVTLIHNLYNNGVVGFNEAKKLLEDLANSPINTLQYILEAYYRSGQERPITITETVTVTETRESTLTTTVTEQITLTETMTTILTETTTSMITQTVTTTKTETSFITQTDTVTLKTTTTVTSTLESTVTETITSTHTVTETLEAGKNEGVNAIYLAASILAGFLMGALAVILGGRLRL